MASCSTKNECIRVYGDCGERYFACRQLQLFSNGSFDYGQFIDVGGWTFKTGNWRILGDTIILNTFKQPEQFLGMHNSNIITNFDSSLTGIKINIGQIDSIFGDFIVCQTKDSVIDTINSFKSCTIDKRIDKVYIYNKSLSDSNGIILFLPSKKNVYTLTTRTFNIDSWADYFKDLRLKIDSNGVYNKTTYIEDGIEKEIIITLKKADLNRKAFYNKNEYSP